MQLEASTQRCSKLSKQVDQERPEMRRLADLDRETETALTVQMEHIGALQKEIVAESIKIDVRDVDKITSLEQVYALLETILAAHEDYRQRVGRKMKVIAEIISKLLAMHQQADLPRFTEI